MTCRYFLERLLQSDTKIYFSAIIFPEFWHAVLKIAIAKDMGFKEEAEVYAYLKKHKKEAIIKHITFINDMQNKFDNLMSLLNGKAQRVYVVETCLTISVEALRFMKDYQLLSYDAIHFASATIRLPVTDKSLEKPSVFDIATFDSDLEGVQCKYLKIWNNGCSYNDILKYEKSIPKDNLQPDGIMAERASKQKIIC